jgi:hypothetical protein
MLNPDNLFDRPFIEAIWVTLQHYRGTEHPCHLIVDFGLGQWGEVVLSQGKWQQLRNIAGIINASMVGAY